MIDLYTPLTFKVNFPADILSKANQTRQLQASPARAKQSYLNVLAVYAVEFYCQCMGIDAQADDSASPIMQTLLDIADLKVGDSRFECRPVTPQQDMCLIPPEVMEDRSGYVMVEVNVEESTATILGFRATVTDGVLQRNALQPLDDLIDLLLPSDPIGEQLQSVAASLTQLPTMLGNWLNNVFETPWQPPELAFAVSHRGVKMSTEDSTGEQFQERAKVVTLHQACFVIVVQVAAIDADKLDITVKVHPGNDQILPQGLLLELLDDDGDVAMMAIAQAADNFIAINFQIETQEPFGARLTLEGDSLTEPFVS